MAEEITEKTTTKSKQKQHKNAWNTLFLFEKKNHINIHNWC